MNRITPDSRIRKGYEFKDIYKIGNAFRSDCLVLFVKKNNINYPRYGLSVGKKIGGAVIRNRVKRRLREIMRELLRSIQGGFDLVFVARKGTEDMNFNDLKDRVKELILRATNKGYLKISLDK
ncbi:MAG: ribonuclease P protein component [Nitrospirae bacterium]|nr:ribonuclease P protein component [Nitrospirota bacterium]